MESNLSELSSIEDEIIYVQPHYKESYRLAIYALLCGGKEAYEEYLRVEKISHFLSEEEICFILENAELPVTEDDSGGTRDTDRVSPSTYFPSESDEEVPELELGWPEVRLENSETSISLLFHPPRRGTPTIKEVVRKQIQQARQVIAIAMDVFTDVDIFKEVITAALRGVIVYILLDDSRVSSFLSMSQSVGINVLDIKNLRVRTVQGEQYQCRSAAKFHGSLEQRFILLDCQTVLYGTYSYSWSFEKLHLSMVLVVTGQLVSSYDEEFRRLYGRSIIPAALSSGSLLYTYPKSSQLSLNHLPMKSRPMPNMRGAMNNRVNDAMLNRGFSVQEMLHQSHFSDSGNLVRGHSYGGDLQKMNSMIRLRMGTKDLGVPVAPGRTGAPLRPSRDVQQSNQASQQHLKHQNRHSTDHNLQQFNSETSLDKWRIDSYLRETDMFPGASLDAQSPVISPHSSYTGLNEYQSQLIHSRSMDIKSRMEEMRQKRLSLQEQTNLRQSQESLRSLYSNVERQQQMRILHGRSRGAEMDPNTENISELYQEAGITEQASMDGKRSISHSNIKMGGDRKMVQNPALARTQSDAELDLKLSDSTLKISNLLSGGHRQSRVMESLIEIPEEKEASSTRGDHFDSARSKDEKVVQRGPQLSSSPVERNPHEKARESYSLIQKRIDSPPPSENKSIHVLSAESFPLEPQRGPTKKEHTQLERSQHQTMKSTTGNLEHKDKENNVSRKEHTFPKSQNTSGSNQVLQKDLYKMSSLERLHKKRLMEKDQSQTSLSGASDTEKRAEKQKSPFSKLSSQRSSKRKTTPSEGQDRGSERALDSEAASSSQIKREKAYSRYEFLISNDKPGRPTRSSDKVKSLSLNRRGEDFRMHQTQGGADNKLGRIMQRMGNFINKNK